MAPAAALDDPCPGCGLAGPRPTVDAYACQHAHAQPPRSVAVHLLGLHAVVARGEGPERREERMRAFSAAGRAYPRLELPSSLGALTVGDVVPARSEAEHEELVRRWARSVRDAWAEHHGTVAAWARELPPAAGG